MDTRGAVESLRTGIARLPDVGHRLIAVAPGFLVYIVLGFLADNSSLKQWWFFVGIGIAVAAVFVEHHFTSPQDGVVNAVAALAAYTSADHVGAEVLWTLYLWLAVFTLACSLTATFRFENLLKRLAYKWATTFGRIVVLGGLALLIELSRRSSVAAPHTLMFGIGVAFLLVTVATRWYVGLRSWAPKSVSPQAVDAIGPGLVLVNRVPSGTKPGDLGRIHSVDGRSSNVVVATTFPGADGTRASVIAESGEWSDIEDSFPASIRFETRTGVSDIVGVVGPDSASQVVRFDPVARVQLGETLEINVDSSCVLYQVADVRLEVLSWDGSRQVGPKATARQIGIVDNGFLRLGSELPAAHSRILRRASDESSELPQGFLRIGSVESTNFAVGVSDDAAKRGHLAVLGMTGMGKTTVVQRICDSLAASQTVIAIDVTGEYLSKESWPVYVDATSPVTVGKSVYEPDVEYTLAARNFVGRCLARAKAEYQAGSKHPRLVVLEEAHGLLPEGHISDWDQKKFVGEATRDVMQSRKYSLSYLFVSQRTAVISKSALSQCESYIVFRTLDDTSLGYLEAIVGPAVRTIVPALKRFEALCFGPAFNSENPIVVTMDPPNGGDVAAGQTAVSGSPPPSSSGLPIPAPSSAAPPTSNPWAPGVPGAPTENPWGPSPTESGVPSPQVDSPVADETEDEPPF